MNVLKLHPALICNLFLALLLLVLFLRPAVDSTFTWFNRRENYWSLEEHSPIRTNKFLEVPQIVWGLNNQKIAFARACLTARLLNRTLLLPNLSASLFYKEIDQLQPISFDKVFNFSKFNNLCSGFVRLGRISDLSLKEDPIEIQKGSGRRWTAERDLEQLNQIRFSGNDSAELIRISGKNPFLWPDHWPLNHYAKIFDCLVLVDEITNAANKVITMIKSKGNSSSFMAVHMRIEKDWMIHCKHLEQRLRNSDICSSKDQIVSRIGKINGSVLPFVVYVAVADSLLEDRSLLDGWTKGIIIFDKKTVGAWEIYQEWPYLIRSAIDFEVCKRADVFVGNSYSTFSSLVVLERSQKLRRDGGMVCGSSYAYNLAADDGGSRAWTTNMDASSLQDISYGTSNISCHR